MDFLKEKCNCMKYSALILLLFSIYSCGQKQTNSQTNSQDSGKNIQTSISSDEYLITDTSFGKINKTTTFNDLENMFGKNNIQDTIDYGAEGMDSFIVTKINSNTPKEIVINWQLDKFHKAIGTVDCFQENAPYHTADSLKIGSTLEKLVQVNGKKINFYGTGWDYGGIITSYNNGKFQHSTLYFQLDAKSGASEKVMGDRELNTDLPQVKANFKKLYIAKISLSLHNSR
jgi:hypothetical protein